MPTFLLGATQLWWRWKHAKMDKGICVINTRANFQHEHQKHFDPSNTVRQLKQTGSICNYINDFIITLMLEITDKSDKDSLFYFQDGLKDWAKA